MSRLSLGAVIGISLADQVPPSLGEDAPVFRYGDIARADEPSAPSPPQSASAPGPMPGAGEDRRRRIFC
jgi:hypothetical protein